MVAAGASLAEIAARFDCTAGTASAGLRRLGLRIAPDAAKLRRSLFLARVGADPRAIEKRTASLKRTINTAAIRDKRAEDARRQWLDLDVRSRTIESLKAAAARLSPEERSKRSAMAGAKKLAWCPAEYREEYARLRRRLGSAKEAKRILMEEIACAADGKRASMRLAEKIRRLHPAFA